MQVIATAGHVDHGKSTLIRALTGMEPDRWAEERRRGMTIDLGFAWTTLRSGERIAFVDVPGHERFVTNMLAGVGPCPAVMIVVAADEGWQAQSAEHLAALDALGVRHGLAVVTRADLAEPELALTQVHGHLDKTCLAGIESVVVSGRTGQGLPELEAALARLAATLPEPDTEGAVRLWIDRVFTVAGAGTVVTGTLSRGTLRVGDELDMSGRRVRIRGLQTLGEKKEKVSATARVAVNLRGVDRDGLSRGMALVTPEFWMPTRVIDVRLNAGVHHRGEAVLHVGSAAVPVRLRFLGGDTARLTLSRTLPLRTGDRGLLRDPGRREIIAGLRVLDVRPPALRRRGAAAARAAALGEVGLPDAAALLRWHGLLRGSELTAMGCPPGGSPVVGDWYADPGHWSSLRSRLADHVSRRPALDPGITVDAATQLLALSDRRLTEALVAPPLAVEGGRILPAGGSLPPAIAKAVTELTADLAEQPFNAPTAERLNELGLTGKALAAALRSGAVTSIAKNVILLPGALDRAADVLARLPSPFTVSDARVALATSRRVVLPLLERLDAGGITRRIDNDLRICRPQDGSHL
ncbi:selenocysteine-specific translation elongation factor [Microtetraspora sp. NBRC 16547]|uniref:selenocysteine-specific translation elongation factor n=1 Tax=Microtetraspora sp. NBRC 16547 TaxID=3030993 RepID=UPI0024A5403F|nr:selenocysteine-specific translation elongation factor [Microtetraspora sp. NBRC 16547]GLW98863.1 selenocysteine-specific translation elongation factor [Microtetraspora sp. NBRC 16547]